MKLYKDDLDIAARRAVQHRENERPIIAEEQKEASNYYSPWRGLFWSVIIGLVMFVGFMCLGYAAVQIGKLVVNWMGL